MYLYLPLLPLNSWVIKRVVNNFQTVFFVYCSVSTNLKGNSTWQYPVDKFFDKMLNKINLQVFLKQSRYLSGTLRSSTIYDLKYFFFLPDFLGHCRLVTLKLKIDGFTELNQTSMPLLIYQQSIFFANFTNLFNYISTRVPRTFHLCLWKLYLKMFWFWKMSAVLSVTRF